MIEVWRPVKDYEDFYEISTIGNVRSYDRLVFRKSGFTFIRKGKLFKQTKTTQGYKIVGLRKDGRTKNKYVHRLVATTFLENKENKPEVNHKDCNKENNKLDNLEWVTSSENQIHAKENGLNKLHLYRVAYVGEQNGKALLLSSQVLDIRSKYIPYKYSVKRLASDYSVSESCIYHIINKTSWTHL